MNKITVVRFSKNGNMVLLNMGDKDKWFFLSKTVESFYKKNPISEGEVVDIKYEEATKKGDADTITFMTSENKTPPTELVDSDNGSSRQSEKPVKWAKYGSPEDVIGKQRGCALSGACQVVSGMNLVTEDEIKRAIKNIFDYNYSLLTK